MAQASLLAREQSAESLETMKPLDFERERKYRLMQHLLWIACAVFWYFSFNGFKTQNMIVGWFTLVYSCIASGWLALTYFIKSHRFMVWSSRIFSYILAGLLLFYICLGGNGNGYALWAYVYLLVTFFMLGKQEGLVVVILFWVLESVLLLSPAKVLLRTEYTPEFEFRYLVSQVLVIIMTYVFEAERERNQTKMHRQQSRLQTSERRAQKAVKQLIITQSQLVQSGKLASIGELAAGVAHELNQPLMVIRGNAQLIKRQISKPAFQIDNLTGFLDTIERNTKRMGFIIDHLRSFSRQSPAQQEPVDINTVISNAFLLMREQLRLRSIEVYQDLQDDLPKILGEANQLEQVILNILTNARDALGSDTRYDQGGRRRRRLIVITTRHNSDQQKVEITCKDTGDGIPAKVIDSIFDPFFTTKAVGKGTGLGLSISYGIVQNHGGQIEVMDTGPDGTTIKVALPVASSDEKSADRETTPTQHNKIITLDSPPDQRNEPASGLQDTEPLV